MGAGKPNKGVHPNLDDEAVLRERVAEAIIAGGGVTVMVEKTGIPLGTMSKYAARSSTASFANAAKIAVAAEIGLDVIAFGGSPIARTNLHRLLDRMASGPSGGWPKPGRSKQVATDDTLITDLDQPGMVSIPRYDEVRPSAGPGTAAVNEAPTTRVAFERHWLTEIGIQTASAVILPARGDSMEPTIMDGSPMLVDTSKTEVQNGYIYVIAVENDLLVKRIRRRLDGRIDLISDNRAYEPETLDAAALQQLRVIGRVYAAVSKF